jgi:hypothetical protein
VFDMGQIWPAKPIGATFACLILIHCSWARLPRSKKNLLFWLPAYAPGFRFSGANLGPCSREPRERIAIPPPSLTHHGDLGDVEDGTAATATEAAGESSMLTIGSSFCGSNHVQTPRGRAPCSRPCSEAGAPHVGRRLLQSFGAPAAALLPSSAPSPRAGIGVSRGAASRRHGEQGCWWRVLSRGAHG